MIKLLQKKDEFTSKEVRDGCLLLVNKEPGWTSFDVVNKIRRIIKVKKVGHAGTLDPFAEGLLVVGIAAGTKSLGRFSGLSKLYKADVFLGAETNTLDCTGSLSRIEDSSGISRSMIENEVKKLSGEIFQIPPMFSAKKVKGKKLYELARKNIEVERKAVKITIYRSEVLKWESPLLQLRLEVSKGTYIRSYADDLGKNMKCGAHLSRLVRESIGEYQYSDAFTIKEFSDKWYQVRDV